MGYVGNFIAIATFIVLPFAGYWLGREIYEYNQQMGITMMGGFMSWLWIVQAVLIGVLFLAGELLPVDGDGAHSRRGALRAVHEVDAPGPRHRLDRVGDAAHDHRHA